MLKNWKFWTVMGVLGGLVILFTVGFGMDPYKVSSPLVGKPAFDFQFSAFNRKETVSLASLRGKPYLLNFWGSWCQACTLEAHLLQQAHDEYEVKRGALRVIGVAMNDTVEAAQGFAKRFGKTYFLALDTKEGDNAINWGVYGAPETFFIDAQGTIVYKHIGALSPEVLKEKIEQLIAIK